MNDIVSDDVVRGIDQELLCKDFWDTISSMYDVTDNRQRRNIIYKHSFFVCCRELTTLSLSSIGKLMDKDHATVLHAIRNHSGKYMYDNIYRAVYDQMYDSFSQKVDTFNEGINNMINKRISRMDVDSFSTVMVKMYKDKLERQHKAYELQIESLKRERTILSKQLKTSRDRAEHLNKECLRLKNLL